MRGAHGRGAQGRSAVGFLAAVVLVLLLVGAGVVVDLAFVVAIFAFLEALLLALRSAAGSAVAFAGEPALAAIRPPRPWCAARAPRISCGRACPCRLPAAVMHLLLSGMLLRTRTGGGAWSSS